MSQNTPVPEQDTQVQRVLRHFGKFMLIHCLVAAGAASLVTSLILTH